MNVCVDRNYSSSAVQRQAIIKLLIEKRTLCVTSSNRPVGKRPFSVMKWVWVANLDRAPDPPKRPRMNQKLGCKKENRFRNSLKLSSLSRVTLEYWSPKTSLDLPCQRFSPAYLRSEFRTVDKAIKEGNEVQLTFCVGLPFYSPP